MKPRRPFGCLFLDLLYFLGAIVVGPLILVIRLARKKRIASPKARMGFGRAARESDRPSIWVHGVSVGEVLAGRGLISALQKRYPELAIVVTSTTVTGLRTARTTYPELEVVEAPYDLSGAVRRFVAHFQPVLLILLELELWPNHLLLAQANGIPVMIANAKLSERSAKGYRRLSRIWRGLPRSVARWCLQSEEHGERARSLGVPEDRLRVTGNLKFDNAKLRDPAALRSRFATEHGFGTNAPVLVAGSTHEGEEAILLETFSRLRRSYPELKLLLAPRHPERLPSVTELVRRAGLEVGFRSRPGALRNPEVVLVDTMGELAELYALGEVAFVGGTLVPVGGHNLLEPAVFGAALVVGPHLHTVRDIAAAFEAESALAIVRDAPGLQAAVSSLLDDPERRRRAQAVGRRIIQNNQGSVERTMTAIAELLLAKRIVPETTHHG